MRALTNSPEIVFIQELQDRLQKNGIQTSVSEENSTFISASGVITSYNVFVDDADFEKAEKIMKELKGQSNQKENLPWCPMCESEDVTKELIKHRHSSIWFAILGPLFFIAGLISPEYLFFFKWIFILGGILAVIQFFRGHTEEKFTCNSCKHTFHRT